MKAVYIDSTIPEKEAKTRFCFPECIMMENAASALEKAVKNAITAATENPLVLIVCGGGNNGADGIALSRRLKGSVECRVILLSEPKTDEGKMQLKMAEAAGVSFISEKDLAALKTPDVIADCIYGSGFHGSLNEPDAELIAKLNEFPSYKIACDIPSGITKNGNAETIFRREKTAFKADETVTMGALKLSLFTDDAKNFTGKITVAELGISSAMFEKCAEPDAYLLNADDMVLPYRKKLSCHKGDFGHAAVILGEKAGAGIIAGTAALKTGSGFVTCVETKAVAKNFRMNPELMISESIPEKTTALLCGSGLGRNEENVHRIFNAFVKPYAENAKPAVIFDADAFYAPDFPEILRKLNDNPEAKVILTPHPKELQVLVNALKLNENEIPLEEVVKNRFSYAKLFARNYKNIVLIAKGAVNYIVQGEKAFITANGTPALAKAGSGDVLAGLCTGLLAQGYSALEAAKTAVLAHGEASKTGKNNFSLTPIKLIANLEKL